MNLVVQFLDGICLYLYSARNLFQNGNSWLNVLCFWKNQETNNNPEKSVKVVQLAQKEKINKDKVG